MDIRYAIGLSLALVVFSPPSSAMAPDVLTARDASEWARTSGRLGVKLKAAAVQLDGRSQFAAELTEIDRTSPLVTSGVRAGGWLLSVNGFRFEDVETLTKYVMSLGSGAPAKIVVIDRQGDKPRVITAKLVDASKLSGQAFADSQAVTISASREADVAKMAAFMRRQEVKAQCEKETARAIPNAIGGAVGGKVGAKAGAVMCLPLLGTVLLGDPGLAYAACVVLATGVGTGTGVAVANSSTDGRVEACTTERLAASK